MARQDRQESDDLGSWVKKLNEMRMPVVARTAQEVSQALADKDSSASMLARIIMRDASMSARVLRIANSSFHRTGGPPICTVSRAVVKLGFGTIGGLTRSVSVVEALLKGEKRERVLREMAQAFHAATQAQTLAELTDPKAGEDVFVAALLYRIGNVGFWCLPDSMTGQLEKALAENPAADPGSIERQVLGFSLAELTTRLSDEWGLSPMLSTALKKPDEADPVTANIRLGHRLAEAIEAGWESEAYAEIRAELAERLNVPGDHIEKMVVRNTELAVENARAFGFPKVAALIPAAHPDDRADDGSDPAADAPAQTFHEPDPKLQLEFLREIATVVEEKPSIGELLDMILEGIHRGIGMDRTLFALLTADKKTLRAKHAVGRDHDRLMSGFAFSAVASGGAGDNIFARQLKTKQPLFIPPDPPDQLVPLLPDNLLAVTGRNGFFSAPIVVANRSIGLFYCDRLSSGRELDHESYQNFRHFTNQANASLTAMTRQSVQRHAGR